MGTGWFTNPTLHNPTKVTNGDGVGKYLSLPPAINKTATPSTSHLALNASAAALAQIDVEDDAFAEAKRKMAAASKPAASSASSGYGNFSNW